MTDKNIIALENRGAEERRLFSPSAARNRDAIRDAFLRTMPLAGTILEIGSGTGEHAVHIAAAAPDLRWLPGDPDAASRASIAAWTEHLRLTNVAPPHALDVTEPDWDALIERADGVVSINMIHIAPFAAARGLVAGAARLLPAGGKLFLYGPFARNGAHTAPSNADFDASLKARNPAWGVRDLDREIAPLAQSSGLALETVIEMPANNLGAVLVQRAPVP
ncbi:MAG TPA: SAM-dependent methyltransferase [Parvularcula sp.]|nr:SAM-dependent methyltransferase [Parvularcula sp.]